MHCRTVHTVHAVLGVHCTTGTPYQQHAHLYGRFARVPGTEIAFLPLEAQLANLGQLPKHVELTHSAVCWVAEDQQKAHVWKVFLDTCWHQRVGQVMWAGVCTNGNRSCSIVGYQAAFVCHSGGVCECDLWHAHNASHNLNNSIPSMGMSRLQIRGNSLVYLCNVMLVLYFTVKYSMFSTLLTMRAGWYPKRAYQYHGRMPALLAPMRVSCGKQVSTRGISHGSTQGPGNEERTNAAIASFCCSLVDDCLLNAAKEALKQQASNSNVRICVNSIGVPVCCPTVAATDTR